MPIQRFASATWLGSLKEGKGSISTESGALDTQPFGFQTRFEEEPGTNPEELIGAAHAACFSMALSLTLSEYDLVADDIQTKAKVLLDKDGEGFAISRIYLDVVGKVPDASDAVFQEACEKTQTNCPVSKLFNADIKMSATLA